MPYSRTRSYDEFIPGPGSFIETRRETYTLLDPDFSTPSNSKVEFGVSFDGISKLSHGSISDETFLPAKGRYSRRRKSKIPRPFKPVDHIVKKVIPETDDHFFNYSRVTPNGTIYLRETTRSYQTSPANWCCERFGQSTILDIVNDINPDIDNLTFHEPDWFSMVSDFNEQFDSLVPSSFFSGESMVESPIYGQIIQAVLRPKKFVTKLLRDVTKNGIRHLNSRQLHKYYKARIDRSLVSSAYELLRRGDGHLLSSAMKEAVNLHLSYQFGVKPAIEEIGLTIAAHISVPQRLDHLSRHAGRYLPLRVRKRIDSSFDSSLPNTPYHDLVVRQSAQHLIACLSGMGRVRQDINEASKWRAYAEYFGLNKIVGTAWELIPFTFVADWFSNAQERINELTRIRLGDSPFCNLSSVGSSTKRVVEHELVITPGYDTTYGLTADQDSPLVAFTVRASKYSRIPGIPDTSGKIDFSSFGLFHGATLGELLIQRLL